MLGNQRARAAEHGFSLFECLIALAVLSTAAIASINLIAQNARAASQIEERALAQFVAENRLAEFKLTRIINRSEQVGEAEMGGREFFWRQTISETSQQGLVLVTVEVSLDESAPALVAMNGFRSVEP